MKENKKIEGSALYVLLTSIKFAYNQYKSNLKYVKNDSNIWKGKPYMWGRTHLSIAKHNIYWHIIKR